MGWDCELHSASRLTTTHAQVGDLLQLTNSADGCHKHVVKQDNHRVGVCLDHGGALDGALVVFQGLTSNQRKRLRASQATFVQYTHRVGASRDCFKFADGRVLSFAEMPNIKFEVVALVQKGAEVSITDEMLKLTGDGLERANSEEVLVAV